MLTTALSAFGLTADIDLELMTHNQTLAHLSAQALTRISDVLMQQQVNGLVVQGDTTTCAFAAVAAFYAKVPLFHVEAGLRSFSMTSPYPEEFNRRVVGLVAQGHFCPTETAAQNLLREGVESRSIHVTGNTGIDALMWMRERLASDAYPLAIQQSPFVLATLHRRESFVAPLQSLFQGFKNLAEVHHKKIILPVHLNPNVRQAAREIFGREFGGIEYSGGGEIQLLEPLDYPRFVAYMLRCSLILTDSGGIQEEATALGKPMLVCRDRTERSEAVERPGVKLLDPLTGDLVTATMELWPKTESLTPSTVFGDGRASQRIVAGIEQFFARGYVGAASGNSCLSRAW